jgi:hypothetical protein
MAIPAAERFSNEKRRAGKWVAIILTAMCAVWFLVFFHIIVYHVAVQSLAQRGLFDQNYALSILQTRHNETDDKVLWKIVESTDWKKKLNPDGDDYRQRFIQILAQHDRAGAAAHLSSLLRQRPFSSLADAAAPILAAEHRYEAAPELMRYALLDAGQMNPAEEALVSMRIPQAALVILREQAFGQSTVFGSPDTSDSQIWPDYEHRLASLLGKDIGRNWGDWVRFYSDSVDHVPTPLTPNQASEVSHVALAITKYWSTEDRLQGSGRVGSIPAPNLDVPGTSALEHEIDKFSAAANPRIGQ